ncbi:MAG: penicillin-binding transpeptidase domain-containing protein, partial [Candidatus Gracilibacteria bacterium]|nr:penicillin-binding transpeptidase domain-containing protein [Candidatus Gracilibacteria bacterium]
LKSAAKYYFNKEPQNLTQAEQIALLVLPKDPKKYDPYRQPKNFRTRFELLIKTLVATKVLTESEGENIRSEQLVFNTDHSNPLPYVSDFLKSRDILSKHLYQTTFDNNLTNQIDTIAKNALRELSWRNVSDYGILIAERTENNPLLRVMIGGASYHESSAGQVNATTALRQPGSTIKPFTYVLAFKNLGLTPEDTILDLPIAYKTSENYSYEPKNYTQDYKGEITLRRALSESINIPAVKIAEKVGVSSLLDFLRSLGITSLTKDADHYGLALTLGDGEISLFELLQAYTIFANNGQFCPFEITTSTETCKKIIDSKYTDMINSILTDRYAKLAGFPLYSPLDFADRIVAVKTGTSRNFRDNWAVGFTPHYMIGVWTGNKSGENMKGVSGATGAGEIFRRIVYTLEPTGQDPKPSTPVSKTQNYLT